MWRWIAVQIAPAAIPGTAMAAAGDVLPDSGSPWSVVLACALATVVGVGTYAVISFRGKARMQRRIAESLRAQNDILHNLAEGAPRVDVLTAVDALLHQYLPRAHISVRYDLPSGPVQWPIPANEYVQLLHATLAAVDLKVDQENALSLYDEGGGLRLGAELRARLITAGYGTLWVEPLLDTNRQRRGEVVLALPQRMALAAGDRVVARAAAAAVGLVLQRDATREGLEQGRELYQSLVDNQPDAVLRLDEHGRIDASNEAAHILFGRSAEELAGMLLADLMEPAVAFILPMRIAAALKGRAQAIDATAPRAGSRPRELELTLIPLREGSNASGLFAVARDLTRFRASERALRRTYELSLLLRDQLIELNQIAIAAAALVHVDQLVDYLAVSMRRLARVRIVRIALDPRADGRGRSEPYVHTVGDGEIQADLLPDSLRQSARQCTEPTRRSMVEFAAALGESDTGEGAPRTWLGLALVDDSGSVVGTLEWFDKHDDEFSDDDEVLATQFARLTTANLQRTRLVGYLRDAENSVAHQLAFVRAMASSVGEGLYAIDQQGRLNFINQAAERMLSLDPGSLREVDAERHFLPPGATDVGPGMRALREGSSITAEHVEFIDRQERRFPVDLVAAPLNLGGEVVGAVVVFRDISDRLRAEEERLERDRFFELSVELFIIIDATGQLLQANAAVIRQFVRPGTALTAMNWREVVHPDDVSSTDAVMAQLLATGRLEGFVNRWVDVDGRVHWLEWAGSLSPDRRIFAVARDISERRRYESELARYATHDSVTGLPRIEQVEAYLVSTLASAAQRGGRVSVFYIDLDRFHAINDSRGHGVGDDVLRTIAERLSKAAGEQGRVTRIAGDEFVIVRVDEGEGPDQHGLGEIFRAAVEVPIAVGDTHIFLTCSVGVSCFPENGTTPRDLIRQSEAAMTRAKDEGRNVVAAFSNDEQQALRDRLDLGTRLRGAIDNRELTLHFQPQISAHNWQVTGVEALVRWNSPELGMLLPGRFIPVAEELGVIVELGQWVLQSACRMAKEWLDSGLADFVVAVNVSSLQLQRPEFLEHVQYALEVSRLPPRYLELELTESMVMAHVDRVIGSMRSLKALGVSLSLDDFGSGYSSLNYLRRFPIDKLKIDHSFVHDIVTDPGSAGICRAVIALGHQLGMMVSAEGVETIGQASFLRRNECDQFQGNYFSQPLPAQQAFEVLRRRYLRQEELGGTIEPQRVPDTLLLLDDEENVIRALVRLLRRDGYHILTATSAKQAYDLLASQPVHVIVSDQRMPDISGTDFLGRVKDLYPDTVRLILSGYSDFASLTEALNKGAVYRFVAKPWDDEELRRTIREAFRISESRREPSAGAA
ncbi:EAL domain-containing protein [Tahibacter amnicola]|uniref:EAL domain-containing protein n=1 Tax=Tahibacter amnicola TaxID=2976241 RepID=A0ABY6BKP1_9GAMM|nr:EAL domain-containing protein [Tahibacter amnicola]UXI70042.1 EAL domain-containing protein [Tahibacter amnicola]